MAGAEQSNLFADEFSDMPFWRQDCPDYSGLTGVFDDLPKASDVVIIGSGYTGLNAALETASGGRSTVVLEAGDPGAGCSTRNGAHISTSIKPDLETLTRRYGSDRAGAIRREGRTALDWIENFVDAKGIACDFRRSGRFHGAHSPAAYDDAARHAEKVMRQEGTEAFAVPRAEQHTEIGSNFYHGGVVFPSYATLHPAKYHHGLMARAVDHGATVIANCTATAIERDGNGFTVSTSQGPVRARDVIVATNGYTKGLIPWLQRRVIPIGSYVIATEPQAKGVIEQLFPSNRLITDTRKVVYYYGPTPDRRRVIFGGRVTTGETDPKTSGRRLHAEMRRIFPVLADARISHSWLGFVAYTFDELPHCGVHDGIHYAMGYCGTGVSLASYLGMRTGQRVLGLSDGKTAFDDLPFPTRPLYTGKPWFLPAAVAFYRWRDQVETYMAARKANR